MGELNGFEPYFELTVEECKRYRRFRRAEALRRIAGAIGIMLLIGDLMLLGTVFVLAMLRVQLSHHTLDVLGKAGGVTFIGGLLIAYFSFRGDKNLSTLA